jgi:Antitoxin VbhA
MSIRSHLSLLSTTELLTITTMTDGNTQPGHDLQTQTGRRAALEQADVSLRIEGLERDPASAPIFEAWMRGEISEEESIRHLIALG